MNQVASTATFLMRDGFSIALYTTGNISPWSLPGQDHPAFVAMTESDDCPNIFGRCALLYEIIPSYMTFAVCLVCDLSDLAAHHWTDAGGLVPSDNLHVQLSAQSATNTCTLHTAI